MEETSSAATPVSLPASALATSPATPGTDQPVAGSSVETDDSGTGYFWSWTTSDRWFLTVLITALVVGLAGQFWRLSGGTVAEPVVIRPEERQYEFRVDVNRGTWVEWMQLEGIGEVLARRIVEDRITNGPFTSIDDVSRVRGVGSITLEKLRPWLVLESEEAQEGSSSRSRSGGP